MKAVSCYALSVSLMFLWGIAGAQNPLCDKLCVTEVKQDTFVPDQLLFSIYLDEDPNVFINYPYIVLATDHEGDSLAQGFLFFFGQFGGTTTEYPATIIPSSLPDPLEGSLLFAYDTNFCQLDFPCIRSSDEVVTAVQELEVRPNPAQESIYVSGPAFLPGSTLQIIHMSGHLAGEFEIADENGVQVSTSHLPEGCYILRVLQKDTFFQPVRFLVLQR